MRALYSSKYSAGAVNTALLLLRIGIGVLMLKHGYDKLAGFNELSGKFMNFMHLGSKISLGLVIFSEFFCSILLILGLFTRLACLPLIVTMWVALFMVKNFDFFGKGEVAALYLVAFVALLLAGPGRFSIDGMIGK